MATQSYIDTLSDRQRAQIYQTIFGYVVGTMTLVSIGFAFLHGFIMRRTRSQVVKIADMITQK